MGFFGKLFGGGESQKEKLPIIKEKIEGGENLGAKSPRFPAGMGKFEAGNISLTPEEERSIRERAKTEGDDPEEAVSRVKAEMEAATRRLRDIKREEEQERIGGIIADLNGELRKDQDRK